MHTNHQQSLRNELSGYQFLYKKITFASVSINRILILCDNIINYFFSVSFCFSQQFDKIAHVSCRLVILFTKYVETTRNDFCKKII